MSITSFSCRIASAVDCCAAAAAFSAAHALSVSARESVRRSFETCRFSLYNCHANHPNTTSTTPGRPSFRSSCTIPGSSISFRPEGFQPFNFFVRRSALCVTCCEFSFARPPTLVQVRNCSEAATWLCAGRHFMGREYSQLRSHTFGAPTST